MIGPITAALPFLAALAVARKEPRHGPIRDALLWAAIYAGASYADARGPDPSPRALLCLWAVVAIQSGWAYLRAWDWSAARGLALGGVIGACLALGILWPARFWTFATWGPFVVSTATGALALWHWWSSPSLRTIRAGERFVRDVVAGIEGRVPVPEIKIVQRIAVVLLASDACMLLFVRWPQVQYWQGRASAIAVTLVQVGWLIEQSSAPRIWTRYNALRIGRKSRLMSLRIAWALRSLPVGKADTGHVYRSIFGE